MSWVCPNCSNSNGEDQLECFVCGMERPGGLVEVPSEVDASETDDCKIVFSDFEAFTESVKTLFGRKRKATVSKSSGTKTVSKKKERSKARKRKVFGSDFAKPWPEHRIKFDEATIRAKGYVRSEQKNMGGVNGYYFYKEDGSGQFIRCEMLLVQKMASKE